MENWICPSFEETKQMIELFCNSSTYEFGVRIFLKLFPFFKYLDYYIIDKESYLHFECDLEFIEKFELVIKIFESFKAIKFSESINSYTQAKHTYIHLNINTILSLILKEKYGRFM